MSPIHIRRSNLLVSVRDRAAVENAWRHDADAITLDLGSESAHDPHALRELVAASIAPCARGGAEVFVRVSDAAVTDDLQAVMMPGVRGIVLPKVESVADVADAAETITALERERNLPAGSIELIVLVESALGVWNLRQIARGSRRIRQVGLDESDLAASLGITPDPDYDPFLFARGRLAVESTAALVGAIGMIWPWSALPQEGSYDELHKAATKARNSGMKGIICPHPSWVAPVNAAFTPTPELVEWNRRVREAFAEGVANGTAAVPLDGRMIDVPVDEWAIVVLEMAEACAKRDAEKAAARQAG